MKKRLRLAVLFLFLLALPVQAASPPVRVVTQVEAVFQNRTYNYSQPQKMAAVLTCLRLLKYQGTAKTNPEAFTGTSCRITVFLSNGHSHRYYVRSGGYLSKDHKPWILVDTDQVERLYDCLEKLPPDTE